MSFGIVSGRLLAASFAFVTTSAFAGDQEIAYTFSRTGETMHYQLFVPSSYTAAKPSPMVVVLHGSGMGTSTFLKDSGIEEIAEKRGYVLVAPMGYSASGGYGGIYPVVVTHEAAAANETRQKGPSGAHQQPVQPTAAVAPDDYVEQRPGEFRDVKTSDLSEAETLAAIADAETHFKVDPTRVYLMGNSMGGVGTAYLAVRYPTRWAAVSPSGGPVAAWAYPFSRLRDNHVAALFVHGEFDEHASAKWSKLLADRAKADGVDAAFLEVPGGNHGLAWTKVLPETFDFFAKHVRSGTDAGAE